MRTVFSRDMAFVGFIFDIVSDSLIENRQNKNDRFRQNKS